MPSIYASGNYVIIDDGVNDQFEIAKRDILHVEDADSFGIFKRDKADVELKPFQIDFASVSTWDSDSTGAAQYADADALRTFLRANTGL